MTDIRNSRIVLDTNWYVSASINRKARRLLYETFIKSPSLTVFYSAELLADYKRVIVRPKFAKSIRPDQVKRFMGFLLPQLVRTNPLPFAGVRDVNDNYLIGLCRACQADFLITGDDDLLSMGTHEQTTVLRMSEFLQMLPHLLPGERSS